MTNAVIHQPDFMPWMGYFSKLIYADKFIVLDNINYSARHYLDRTQIINTQGNLMWIKLPIGEPIKKKVNEIYFSDTKVVEKIIQNLHSSYSKARFFKDNITYIENILIGSFENSNLLSEINISIVIKIMEILNLKIPQIKDKVIVELFVKYFDASWENAIPIKEEYETAKPEVIAEIEQITSMY